MIVKTFSINQIKEYLQKNEKKKVVVVSVQTFNPKPMSFSEYENIIDYIELQFDDVNKEYYEQLKKMSSMAGSYQGKRLLDVKDINMFNSDQAKQIYAIIDKHRKNIDEILVHCEYGKSRSTAIGEALRKVYKCDIFHSNFLIITPNPHVFKVMMDER